MNPAAFSDRELLCMLHPQAGELLESVPNLASLHSMQEEAMAYQVSPNAARRVAAAMEISRRATAPIAPTRLESPEDLEAFFAPRLRYLPTEHMEIALLDARLNLLRLIPFTTGIVTEVLCHPRDVLHHAVLHNAPYFVLVHNHPSGDPSPSRPDREMTKRIAAAADIHQINFVDHLIIGKPGTHHEGFFSFREAGLL